MKKPSLSPLVLTQMIVVAALILPLAACSGMTDPSRTLASDEAETAADQGPQAQPVEAPVVTKPEPKPELPAAPPAPQKPAVPPTPPSSVSSRACCWGSVS